MWYPLWLVWLLVATNAIVAGFYLAGDSWSRCPYLLFHCRLLTFFFLTDSGNSETLLNINLSCPTVLVIPASYATFHGRNSCECVELASQRLQLCFIHTVILIAMSPNQSFVIIETIMYQLFKLSIILKSYTVHCRMHEHLLRCMRFIQNNHKRKSRKVVWYW